MAPPTGPRQHLPPRLATLRIARSVLICFLFPFFIASVSWRSMSEIGVPLGQSRVQMFLLPPLLNPYGSALTNAAESTYSYKFQRLPVKPIGSLEQNRPSAASYMRAR